MSFTPLTLADPRLGMRVHRARPDSVDTQFAIRAVSEICAILPETLVAAPLFGIPVNIIGLFEREQQVFLLNPRLTEVHGYDLNFGETGPLTGPLRMSRLRAREVTLSGIGLLQEPVSLRLSGHQSLMAQQALEIIYAQHPGHWLTGFHWQWARSTSSEKKAHFEAVNAGLFNLPLASHDLVLEASGLNRVALRARAADAAPLALLELDAANPMLPLHPVDQAILALCIGLSELKSLYFAAPHGLAVALAASLIRPEIALQADPSLWPAEIVQGLGLGRNFRPMPPPWTAGVRGAFELAVHDAIRSPETLPRTAAEWRAVSRAVAGLHGATLVATPAENANLADQLAQVFDSVFLITGPGGCLYGASKSPVEGELIRSRVMTFAMRYELAPLAATLGASWVRLRKDGQRCPI